MAQKLTEAVPTRDKHVKAFEDFSTSFSTEKLAEWGAMVEAWQEEPGVTADPYAEPVSSTLTPCPRCMGLVTNPPLVTAESTADVRAALAREEAQASVGGAPMMHEMTASAFLHHGMELEDQQ